MIQIKVILFLLATFFGVENGKIAAEKTLVKVNPEKKKIEIVQQSLFAIIQTENDSSLVVKQWAKILDASKNKHTAWSIELDNFPSKELILTSTKDTVKVHLTLNYTSQEDLLDLGISYDSVNNHFLVFNDPGRNIKTENGLLVGNDWVFDVNDSFVYTIEPFLEMQEEFTKLKRPLEKIIKIELNTTD